MTEINDLNRQKRGQVSQKEIQPYANASEAELRVFLHGPDPQKRTIAAVLIGSRKITGLIPELCNCLRTEPSLYPRIAISEALGKMGEPAVIPLMAMLGKIGQNQETGLPEKYCAKRSFPLARDLAARTLVKIGKPAIPELMRQLEAGEHFETQQAIDAIGGIVGKTDERRPLPVLLKMLADHPGDEVTAWKIIRACSAFKQVEAVIDPLIAILKNHPQPALRWEAARSIGQVGIATPAVVRVLQNALQDPHGEVRKSAKIALEQIKK